MDDVLHAHFHRVDSALATLVDSIATYNPSTQAALDLVAADETLSRGLDELAQHQANHARIQTLRDEADALEAQLRSSVAVLAGLRRELYETPATAFPEDSRPVPFDELLQYAKNISKYTVPPTYRERVPTPSKPAHPAEGVDDGASGVASNAVDTPADASLPTAATQDTATGGAEGEEAPKDVTAEEAEWLKKLNESQVPWFPWPSYDRIRESNLMQVQHLLDSNKRPEDIDITKMGDEDKEQMAAEARERLAAQAAAAEVVEPPVQTAPRPALASKPEEPATKFQGFDDYESD